jgi:predicted aminopeptidase
VFHELAHQKLYVAGDTAFNESYATAVAPGRGALAGAARRRRGPARRRRWRSSTSGTFASSRTPHAPS